MFSWRILDIFSSFCYLNSTDMNNIYISQFACGFIFCFIIFFIKRFICVNYLSQKLFNFQGKRATIVLTFTNTDIALSPLRLLYVSSKIFRSNLCFGKLKVEPVANINIYLQCLRLNLSSHMQTFNICVTSHSFITNIFSFWLICLSLFSFIPYFLLSFPCSLLSYIPSFLLSWLDIWTHASTHSTAKSYPQALHPSPLMFSLFLMRPVLNLVFYIYIFISFGIFPGQVVKYDRSWHYSFLEGYLVIFTVL